MEPKLKAIELVNKCSIKVSVYFIEDSIPRIVNADLRKESAKQYALIAVDEILNILNIWDSFNIEKSSQLMFWQEVKQEIKKL